MKTKRTKFKMNPKYPHHRSEGTHPHRSFKQKLTRVKPKTKGESGAA